MEKMKGKWGKLNWEKEMEMGEGKWKWGKGNGEREMEKGKWKKGNGEREMEKGKWKKGKAHDIEWYYFRRNLQWYSFLKLWSLFQCFRKLLYHYKRTNLIASVSVPCCSVVRPRENNSIDSDLINQCNFLWPHFHFSLKQNLYSRY